MYFDMVIVRVGSTSCHSMNIKLGLANGKDNIKLGLANGKDIIPRTNKSDGQTTTGYTQNGQEFD